MGQVSDLVAALDGQLRRDVSLNMNLRDRQRESRAIHTDDMRRMKKALKAMMEKLGLFSGGKAADHIPNT